MLSQCEVWLCSRFRYYFELSTTKRQKCHHPVLVNDVWTRMSWNCMWDYLFCLKEKNFFFDWEWFRVSLSYIHIESKANTKWQYWAVWTNFAWNFLVQLEVSRNNLNSIRSFIRILHTLTNSSLRRWCMESTCTSSRTLSIQIAQHRIHE